MILINFVNFNNWNVDYNYDLYIIKWRLILGAYRAHCVEKRSP